MIIEFTIIFLIFKQINITGQTKCNLLLQSSISPKVKIL